MSILEDHVGMPRNEGQQDVEARKKRKRAAFAMKSMKTQMVSGLDPNYRYHWASDELGRIPAMQLLGYMFVLKGEVDWALSGSYAESLDSRIGMPVGKGDNGQAVMAYLMKIPADEYEENQQISHEQDFQMFEQLRKGPPSGSPYFADHREGIDRGGRKW